MNTYEIEYNGNVYKTEAKVCWDEGQRGGLTDPSWAPHFFLDGVGETYVLDESGAEILIAKNILAFQSEEWLDGFDEAVIEEHKRQLEL
jgi:hypothetical protein